jgi:hypothetical protein
MNNNLILSPSELLYKYLFILTLESDINNLLVNISHFTHPFFMFQTRFLCLFLLTCRYYHQIKSYPSETK